MNYTSLRDLIICQSQLMQCVFAFRNSRLSHNLRNAPALSHHSRRVVSALFGDETKSCGLDEGPMVSGTGFPRLLTVATGVWPHLDPFSLGGDHHTDKAHSTASPGTHSTG